MSVIFENWASVYMFCDVVTGELISDQGQVVLLTEWLG
jgi:hypothetical protein